MAWGNNKRGGGNRRSGGGGGNRGKSNYQKVAQVALWENPNGGNGQPVLYGSVEMEDGRELRISLWESDSDHSKAPVLTGSITREVGGESRGGGGGTRSYGRGDTQTADDDGEPDFDDDLPF